MAHVRLTLALSLAACSDPPLPPPPPRPAAPPAPIVELGFPQGALGRLEVPRFGVTLALPDRAGWTPVNETSSFVVLDHPATSSRLVFSLWSEPEVMSRERCEERARSLRDLPAVEAEPAPLGAPRGFDTAVRVGVLSDRPGAPIRGQLVAFGAEARRCLALAFSTEANGPDSERRVAERLAIIEEITLRRMRLASELNRE